MVQLREHVDNSEERIISSKVGRSRRSGILERNILDTVMVQLGGHVFITSK